MNKFELVRQLISALPSRADRARLLDVGCRDCALRPHVVDLVDYEGLDLFQNAEGGVAHVHDVERGLPFPDRSYDVVVALDLLEHLNDFQRGLQELFRVARRRLMLVLPNTSHVAYRFDYLLHGRFTSTDKYALRLDAGPDRHRWLSPLSEADEYLAAFAARVGAPLERHRLAPGQRTGRAARVARALGVPASLWAWSSMYVLTRD